MAAELDDVALLLSLDAAQHGVGAERAGQQALCGGWGRALLGRDTAQIQDTRGKFARMALFGFRKPEQDFGPALVLLLFAEQSIELRRLDLPVPCRLERGDDPLFVQNNLQGVGSRE